MECHHLDDPFRKYLLLLHSIKKYAFDTLNRVILLQIKILWGKG